MAASNKIKLNKPISRIKKPMGEEAEGAFLEKEGRNGDQELGDNEESAEDDDQFQVEEQDHDDDEAEDSSTKSSASFSDSGDKRDQSDEKFNTEEQQQPSDLIKLLQVSAKADIEKAKAVKNQLSMYDRILAIRIGVQKPLVATNKLVKMTQEVGTSQDQLDDNIKEQARIAVDELLAIGSKIGGLRTTLMGQIDGEPPTKRQKNNQDVKDGKNDNLRDSLEEANQLDKRLSSYLRTTVRKWSTKVNSTTSFNSKKFDTTLKQQNVMDQLERIWSSKDEKDKLILRSRTDRQRPNPLLNKSSDSLNHPLYPMIFEDRDFYLSLLEDVVESATRKQDLAEEAMVGNSDYRANRVHRQNVDPRATKGRKIRYNTHEKLISVMVPIQNELWTDEQKDELFASLFGFGFENDDKLNTDPQQSLLSKSDGFKLF